jgi:hypothetical protein
MPSLLSLGATVALSATGLFAHPLSNAQLVSRADDLLPEYDYVVVGAGASGLTVANRLSEDKGTLTPCRGLRKPLTRSYNRCDRTRYRGWRSVGHMKSTPIKMLICLQGPE